MTFLEFLCYSPVMGNPAGVRRDFQKLEERSLLGARLLRQGVHPAEVARQVGVHRQSVSRWAEQLKQGGVRALKKAGRAGRRARLRPEDLGRIERGLKLGPEALGYDTGCGLRGAWRADRTRMRVKVSPRACLADVAAARMELPASSRTGSGAQ